jgi:hypothetical protein
MRTFDRSVFEIGSWRAWSVWLARLVGLVVVFGFSLLLGTALPDFEVQQNRWLVHLLGLCIIVSCFVGRRKR